MFSVSGNRPDLRRPRSVLHQRASRRQVRALPDVLTYIDFPAQDRGKLHDTNLLERLNGEIKRRTKVVSAFPNEATLIRLVGAILLEQSVSRPSSAPAK